MQGGIKYKKVDVSIFKSYNWDCPRCGAFNNKQAGPNEDKHTLICKFCGAQVKYFKGAVNDWFFEEK